MWPILATIFQSSPLFVIEVAVMVLLPFPRQNFTNTIPYCLYLRVIYFFEHEKKICDDFFFFPKDLSKVDSGSKTRSV